MKIRTSYKHTIAASYVGYITQAIVNNFAPLLFLTFQQDYSISLGRITLLVTLNFVIQLCVDLFSAKYVDRIGYRRCAVLAHVFAAVGLAGLGLLPELLPSPYVGLACAVVVYAIGGGLIEVLISPIVEACPTREKSAAMSLLHSFYCWGSLAVIALSTLLFFVWGIGHWRAVSCLWAIVPVLNAFYFSLVPIAPITAEGEGMTVSWVLGSRLFWILALMMVCSGASEQAMSQWASAFAESGLHISKTMGDLAGPCFFALLMGLARVLHARLAGRVSLERYMALCALLCAASYALAAYVPVPLVSLLGCGICGFSVGAMWPGTYSLAARSMPRGGTALFALLALAGDLGCTSGPTLVGFISGVSGDNLKAGLAAAAVFPVLLLAGLALLRWEKK